MTKLLTHSVSYYTQIHYQFKYLVLSSKSCQRLVHGGMGWQIMLSHKTTLQIQSILPGHLNHQKLIPSSHDFYLWMQKFTYVKKKKLHIKVKRSYKVFYCWTMITYKNHCWRAYMDVIIIELSFSAIDLSSLSWQMILFFAFETYLTLPISTNNPTHKIKIVTHIITLTKYMVSSKPQNIVKKAYPWI